MQESIQEVCVKIRIGDRVRNFCPDQRCVYAPIDLALSSGDFLQVAESPEDACGYFRYMAMDNSIHSRYLYYATLGSVPSGARVALPSTQGSLPGYYTVWRVVEVLQ